MNIDIGALKRAARNFKSDKKWIIIGTIVTVVTISFVVFSYKATMFVGGVVGSAFAGENKVDVDKSIPVILGKKSSHYQGCGFPELKWGMNIDEVKKALPQDVLTLNRSRSSNGTEIYENRKEFAFIFKDGKLIATSKYFPFSNDGSNLISQAIELFGDFEDDNHFRMSLENTVSSMKMWHSIEAVLYNCGDTQAAVIIVVQGGNQRRSHKALFLSFIDTREVQGTLEEYAAQVAPQISWTTALIGGIKDDGKLNDVTTAPPHMVMEKIQYTPGLHRIGVSGEPKPEESMDGWQIKNEVDKDKHFASLTLEIDRARTNQYKDLPLGNAKGLIYPGKIHMPKISHYLVDHHHVNLLYLRLNDIILQKAVAKSKVTHYLQGKLGVEKVGNIPMKGVPYCRVELPNGYVFELFHTNEIKFHKPVPGEKIM